jgi:hypothetical protein
MKKYEDAGGKATPVEVLSFARRAVLVSTRHFRDEQGFA